MMLSKLNFMLYFSFVIKTPDKRVTSGFLLSSCHPFKGECENNGLD